MRMTLSSPTAYVMFDSCGRPSRLMVVSTPSRCDRARPRASERSMPSAKHVGHEVDQETGHAADDGPVDADELQVAAEQELELVGRLVGVPAGDGRRDQRRDLVTM